MEDHIFEKFSDSAQKLLKKAKNKFGQAEVITGVNNNVLVIFENGKLNKVIQTNDNAILGLRITDKGCLGLTGSLKIPNVSQLMKEGEVSAHYGTKSFFNFPNNPTGVLAKPKIFDDDVPQTSIKKIVLGANKALDCLRRDLSDFTPEALVFHWSWGKVRIINSSGLDLSRSGTQTEMSLEVAKRKENDFFTIESDRNSRKWESKVLDLVDEVKIKASLGKKIVNISEASPLIVFSPEAVGSLISYLSYSLNGRVVNDRSSRLLGKLGKRLFDKRINLTDSPLEDFRPSSLSFDDEGTPTSNQPLINNGVVSSFLYDLQEGGKAGVKSTGSGSRGSVYSNVSPVSSNLILSGGKKPWNSILKGIKKGILVHSFIGEGQGNMANGDFSLSIQLGYFINNGEIVGRVKNLGIAGNVFKLLKEGIVDLSKETEWHGFLSAPYLVLDGVSLTAMS